MKAFGVLADDTTDPKKTEEYVVIDSSVTADTFFDLISKRGFSKIIVFGDDAQIGPIRRIHGIKQGRIYLPPGSFANKLADFIFPRKTMDRVVRPILSDMQTEYFEALTEDKKAKARWILIRDHGNLLKALGLHIVIRNLIDIWKIVRPG